MIEETTEFNKLCDGLDKFASQKQLSPEELAEALDLKTQATVVASKLFMAAQTKIRQVSKQIDQIDVVVDEPEDSKPVEPPIDRRRQS